MTTLSFELLWKDRGVKRGFQEIGQQADRTQGKFSKFSGVAGKGLKGVGLAAAGLAAGGAAALGAMGVAGAVMGTKIASGNEQAKISFTTMLGSAAKADKFLRQLQKFAAETPFEFPELQTAASSLISAGINANKVVPIMRTLGDVTSGMGTGSEGVQRATIALQQMSAAGRITGEDLNQLRDAGIPVFDLLAKATGKSKEEVVKLAQSGKLGKKELGQMMEALESGKGLERFSGLMEKQSKSLAGTWSTLKDTVGQGLAGVMENSLPMLKDGIGTISALATSAFGWVEKNKGSISGLFNTARVSLASFGRIAKAVLTAFIGSTGDGTKSFKSFADFIETHQESIIAMFVGAAKGSMAMGRAIAQGASIGLRSLAWLVEKTGDMRGIWLDAMSSILRGATLSFGWIPGIGPKLRAAESGFSAFAAKSKSSTDKAAKGMRGIADGIDSKVIPAIDKSARALDKIGKKEIIAARARDNAAKAKKAIDAIGTAANGSQVKMKKFSDITKLSADKQKGLESRLDLARSSLRKQISAMKDAGSGQEKLTRAWEKGRDRLYKEFKQMGLSSREAKKLADRYAGVKPKVQTKFSTPGLSGARNDTKDLDQKINNLNNKSVSIKVRYSKSGAVRLGVTRNDRGGGVTKDASGGVLPGYTPGRDVHYFQALSPGVPDLHLSGGEAIMRPEWVKAIGGVAEVHRQNRLARTGRLQAQALASGGVYRDIRVRASANNPPNVSGDYASAYAYARSQAASSARAAAVASARAEVARQKAAARRAAARARAGGGDGGYSGPVGGGSSGIRRIANSYNPSYIAGHRDPQGGPAFDIGSSGSKNNNIANALRSNHGKLGLRYVISRMRIASGRSGWRWRGYTPITGSGDFRHVNHVHVSYDKGGMLPSGGVGANRSGRPERVLSPKQTMNFERLTQSISKSGGAIVHNHYTINAPNYVGPQRELVKALETLDSRGALDKVARNFARRT